VILQDVIDSAEHWFECREGFPGREAIYCDDKTVYHSLRFAIESGKTSPHANEPISEHILVCKATATLEHIKNALGYSNKRKLYWRYADKVQLEQASELMILRMRIYIEGCRDYGHFDQGDGYVPASLRLVANNDPDIKPIVSLRERA
jgi:hypothetical protein